MTPQHWITQTHQYMLTQLANAEAGHDWMHVERVWRNTQLIAQTEACNPLVAELGALLHDIADSKFHGGDEQIGPRTARQFLESIALPQDVVEQVVAIVQHISYAGGNEPSSYRSPELAVVQDADRLDAIGAIGIARTFHYGGYKNRLLYHPDIAPRLDMTRAEYKASTAPTINHFYEKLLLLKDRMNTATGRRLAEERHRFMELYLEQFFGEWNGKI